MCVSVLIQIQYGGMVAIFVLNKPLSLCCVWKERLRSPIDILNEQLLYCGNAQDIVIVTTKLTRKAYIYFDLG